MCSDSYLFEDVRVVWKLKYFIFFILLKVWKLRFQE